MRSNTIIVWHHATICSQLLVWSFTHEELGGSEVRLLSFAFLALKGFYYSPTTVNLKHILHTRMYIRIQCNWLVIGWVTCIEYHLQHDFHLSYIWYAYSLFWPNIKTLEIFLLEKNFPYVKSGHPLKDEEWEANALSLIVVYLVHFCSELHFQTFEFLHWSWDRGKKLA